MKLISLLNENGQIDSQYQYEIDEKSVLKAYRVMCLTRHIDERMITLQRQGQITFALSSKGEEACAVGGAAALKFEDWIYPQYREVGVMFWRGSTALEHVNQMFGNKDDPALGRQMPNHFGSRKLNVVNVSSTIATQIPHAAGSAYAMRLNDEQTITLCYFGDGATSEGDFHCGLNFAAVRKTPAIFFCRNNGFAISTPLKDQFASDGVAPKGVGYGVKTYRVDGNDFFAVHHVVSEARKLCLEGNGPVLIEAITYRLGAHSTSDDPSRYRSDTDVGEWEQNCPIKRLRKYLDQQGLWDDEKETRLQEEIKNEVNEAIESAKTTPPPPIDSLILGVYREVPPSLEGQLDEVKRCLESEGLS